MAKRRIFTPQAGARAPTTPASVRPLRFRGWAIVAVGVVAVGSALSSIWAQGIARTDDVRVRQSFETTALEISGALHAAIQQQEDLVVSTGAFVASNPDVTMAQLGDWISSVRAEERYPELLGVGAMRFVRDADLDAFIAKLRADPAVPTGPNGDVTVTPAGTRPFYCLLQAIVALEPSAAAVSPFGWDYCASEVGPVILAARDSGTASILAVPGDVEVMFVVQTPIYRDGRIPTTVAGRRAAYVGSLGTSLAPGVLLSAVSLDDPDVTITLTHDGVQSTSYSNGDVPQDAESVREELGNGWSATVARPTPERGLLASDRATGLLVAGTAVSVLFGLLIYALGTGRQRALRLVTRRTDQLRHQALHDGLTGLPNRTLILDRIEQLLVRCRRHGTVGAALYIDLDSFKEVNDTLGHDAGDELLQSVAARLTTGLRGVDTIGRMGGDEFVVLVEDGSSVNSPELVAERLLDIMRQPFDLELSAQPIRVTASVGIATTTTGDAVDLLGDADIALYRAKAGGRDCYETFRPDMGADVRSQYALVSELSVALERQQFRLLYQPIYGLSDLSIIGAEALIRWDHPTRGLLQPNDFIPALELGGGIVDVGRWVLIEACRQARAWAEGGDTLTVAVNVSARQLDHDSIVDHVAEALALSGLDPAHLTIEITETALMRDTELTARRLHQLKDLGVQLAVDDFGTGYSSLAYLQRFPVDSLKIDRAFVSTIATSTESNALLHTLVKLGKDLGLTTLAEGIESIAELDRLRAFDVDQAQGFLLSRPLAPAAFERQLLISGRRDAPALTVSNLSAVVPRPPIESER